MGEAQQRLAPYRAGRAWRIAPPNGNVRSIRPSKILKKIKIKPSRSKRFVRWGLCPDRTSALIIYSLRSIISQGPKTKDLLLCADQLLPSYDLDSPLLQVVTRLDLHLSFSDRKFQDIKWIFMHILQSPLLKSRIGISLQADRIVSHAEMQIASQHACVLVIQSDLHWKTDTGPASSF